MRSYILNMTTNYQFLYMAFLIIVGIGVVGVLTIDFEDKGACRTGVDGKIYVRQPDSEKFIESEFCIIINS